jgi:DNA polymerase-4
VLRLRFDDFSRATRSHTMAEPNDDTAAILVTARSLLGIATPLIRTGGCTLVGISLANLADADDPFQPELPLALRDLTRLDRAMDGVRERFGSTSITRAVLLGRDQGMTVPMLPD